MLHWPGKSQTIWRASGNCVRPGRASFGIEFDETLYREKLAGALLGRMAGCTLGAPVEGWPIRRMENLARENGDPFPPVEYWKYVPEPFELRYDVSPIEAYTRTKMAGVPVDDDITYTLLGLLILEELDRTSRRKMWRKPG